jgi:nitrite reductase (NADH) small subunit
MSDVRWIRVTTIDSIPRREGRAVALGGREIAIFNLGPSTALGAGPSTALGAGDRFLAVENRCPHQGGPLADGIVSGCAVVCPLHAWKVRLDTGGVDRPSSTAACVRTFATRVEGDTVLVQLPALTGTTDGAERAA